MFNKRSSLQQYYTINYIYIIQYRYSPTILGQALSKVRHCRQWELWKILKRKWCNLKHLGLKNCIFCSIESGSLCGLQVFSHFKSSLKITPKSFSSDTVCNCNPSIKYGAHNTHQQYKHNHWTQSFSVLCPWTEPQWTLVTLAKLWSHACLDQCLQYQYTDN